MFSWSGLFRGVLVVLLLLIKVFSLPVSAVLLALFFSLLWVLSFFLSVGFSYGILWSGLVWWQVGFLLGSCLSGFGWVSLFGWGSSGVRLEVSQLSLSGMGFLCFLLLGGFG